MVVARGSGWDEMVDILGVHGGRETSECDELGVFCREWEG